MFQGWVFDVIECTRYFGVKQSHYGQSFFGTTSQTCLFDILLELLMQISAIVLLELDVTVAAARTPKIAPPSRGCAKSQFVDGSIVI
jgi:hypothetical protein